MHNSKGVPTMIQDTSRNENNDVISETVIKVERKVGSIINTDDKKNKDFDYYSFLKEGVNIGNKGFGFDRITIAATINQYIQNHIPDTPTEMKDKIRSFFIQNIEKEKEEFDKIMKQKIVTNDVVEENKEVKENDVEVIKAPLDNPVYINKGVNRLLMEAEEKQQIFDDWLKNVYLK